jgi:hypothetical protein
LKILKEEIDKCLRAGDLSHDNQCPDTPQVTAPLPSLRILRSYTDIENDKPPRKLDQAHLHRVAAHLISPNAKLNPIHSTKPYRPRLEKFQPTANCLTTEADSIDSPIPDKQNREDAINVDATTSSALPRPAATSTPSILKPETQAKLVAATERFLAVITRLQHSSHQVPSKKSSKASSPTLQPASARESENELASQVRNVQFARNEHTRARHESSEPKSDIGLSFLRNTPRDSPPKQVRWREIQNQLYNSRGNKAATPSRLAPSKNDLQKSSLSSPLTLESQEQLIAGEEINVAARQEPPQRGADASLESDSDKHVSSHDEHPEQRLPRQHGWWDLHNQLHEVGADKFATSSRQRISRASIHAPDEQIQRSAQTTYTLEKQSMSTNQLPLPPPRSPNIQPCAAAKPDHPMNGTVAMASGDFIHSSTLNLPVLILTQPMNSYANG